MNLTIVEFKGVSCVISAIGKFYMNLTIVEFKERLVF